MNFFRYGAWSFVVGPTIIFAVLMYVSPSTIVGGEKLNASLILSLAGVALSYYGLIFSLYAALQVQAISSAYFFKTRSPQLRNKLARISKTVSDFGNEPANQLRSQDFISEVSVALRAVQRVENRHVKAVAKQTQSALSTLKDAMRLPCDPNASAGQVVGYWEFYQKITELADELREQIKDMDASA